MDAAGNRRAGTFALQPGRDPSTKPGRPARFTSPCAYNFVRRAKTPTNLTSEQLPRPDKHLVQHRGGELPRVRVLLAHVVAAEHRGRSLESQHGAVRET